MYRRLSSIFGERFRWKRSWVLHTAHTNRGPNKQKVCFIFVWSGSELWTFFSKLKFKNQKPIAVNDFFRPIQWCHSLADAIWPDGTFNLNRRHIPDQKKLSHFDLILFFNSHVHDSSRCPFSQLWNRNYFFRLQLWLRGAANSNCGPSSCSGPVSG